MESIVERTLNSENIIRRKLRMIESVNKIHKKIHSVQEGVPFDRCFAIDKKSGNLVFWFKGPDGEVHTLTEYNLKKVKEG